MTTATHAQNARTKFLSGEFETVAEACESIAAEHNIRPEDIWQEHEAMIDRELEELLGSEGYGSCSVPEPKDRPYPHTRPMCRVSH